jgi:hypothetical protein
VEEATGKLLWRYSMVCVEDLALSAPLPPPHFFLNRSQLFYSPVCVENTCGNRSPCRSLFAMDVQELLASKLGAWAEEEDSNDATPFAAAFRAQAAAAAGPRPVVAADTLRSLAEDSRDGINLLFKTVRVPTEGGGGGN